MKPPPLRNDCFAMPPGVEWTPVDDALAALRSGLACVVGVTECPVPEAGGRFLAAEVSARRAHPPFANSAVDGYGFAHAGLPADDIVRLPLAEGRSAAGEPYTGRVPAAHAIRILTGARIPDGVDTVVLEEDTTTDGTRISFRRGIKAGANTRCAGEDVGTGARMLGRGRRLRPQDLALLAACGVGNVQVYERLRVAVMSTGDEITEVGSAPRGQGTIFDANRPMLCDLLRRWGITVVDLGHVPDDRSRIRECLDVGAGGADAIFSSGGASAGDEDHVSALLEDEGALSTWRVAIKPGRPLAMALWRGVPVFGLPGNPVAAFVCTLIFARPALGVLAGGRWEEPVAYRVPAGFAKRKKPGRREYLRARIDSAGRAVPFGSEGSGRISGLSWSDGLVELGDGAMDLSEGDTVKYFPYSGFGL